ncbi:CMRF35-like molecule 8 isoform X3 [Ailuropoda melanoleuca]|uniref:CMRF35-like molecule 8 isoform X3 n=1 Tax=Ailuropoda melanoleuca TaxID=9646 RepID=UPI0014946B27|nr:CMRF35-like molecule 8 isoform X3 [Ailuropoda melanoleuca]
MTWQGRVAWLPWALLLVWGPGSWSLSGPNSMTGTVGRSLSVQCRYEEKYRENAKYWCKNRCVWKIVETKAADREVRKDRVSIRDHRANLTFTVTLESLTKAKTTAPPVSTTVTPMSTITAKILTTPSQSSSTAPTTMGATHSASSQEEFPPSQGLGLQILLSLLALLLLLLGGSSLLAWRMVRRRVKSGKNPEPLRTPSQATQQGEPHYANLELQMWPLRGEPVHPRQAEVEYSTVKAPGEEPHYSSVVFDFQNEGSKASRIRSQRTLEEETQYSVIKKT